MAARGESWALKRVLCATDFSDNAAAALDAAVALARPVNAKILLVHVTPVAAHSKAVGPCRSASHGVDRRTRADVLENLERFARPALAAGVETEPVVRHGDPAEEILREAEKAGADLIVMGRHSRAPDHWFLGSVTEHVVGKTPCPVLVMKPFPRLRGQRPRHVLCALDLGETASATLAHAAALTRLLDADLLVLHVLADTAHGTVQDADVGLSALVSGALVASRRVQQRVVTGTPGEEILSAAGREGDTHRLVVVGSHGGSILDRQFIGSTTLQLLRRSECDVLVVPAQVSAGEGQAKTRSTEAADVPAPRSLGRA